MISYLISCVVIATTVGLINDAVKVKKKWAFYGCSNFATYDCQYKKWFTNKEIEDLTKDNININQTIIL